VSSSSPVILIVEDDRDTRLAICSILAEAEYRVLEADTGPAALDQVRRHHLDAILLDLGLPLMNGLDVAQLLNRDPLTASIPIVALTGSWLADQPGHLFSAGFSGALRKPFRAPELLATVRGILQGHPQLDF
jgi:CheY-like chemotaxis protein